MLPQCAALAHLILESNLIGPDGVETWQEPCRIAAAVRSAGSPRSQRQSDCCCRGRESCRNTGAVPSAGSPRSLRQWDRRCWDRVPCRSAGTVYSAGSPQSLQRVPRLTSPSRSSSLLTSTVAAFACQYLYFCTSKASKLQFTCFTSTKVQSFV